MSYLSIADRIEEMARDSRNKSSLRTLKYTTDKWIIEHRTNHCYFRKLEFRTIVPNDNWCWSFIISMRYHDDETPLIALVHGEDVTPMESADTLAEYLSGHATVPALDADAIREAKQQYDITPRRIRWLRGLREVREDDESRVQGHECETEMFYDRCIEMLCSAADAVDDTGKPLLK